MEKKIKGTDTETPYKYREGGGESQLPWIKREPSLQHHRGPPPLKINGADPTNTQFNSRFRSVYSIPHRRTPHCSRGVY